MKLSHIGIIAVMLLVIAVACAGCSSAQTSTPSGGTGQAGAASSGGGAASSGAGAASSGSGSSAGSSSGGAGLFGGLSYNYVEYKIVSNANGQDMTIYFKYDKSGKCSMRFEGAAAASMPASMQNIDCSSKGGSSGQTQANPNTVSSDATVNCGGDESVTVPAGTFTATKCTVTAKGGTETVWVVKNKFLVKMQANANGQAMEMDLNSYG